MSAKDKLLEIAICQYGYVTTADATNASVSRRNLSKLTKEGIVDKVAPGIYKYAALPVTRFDEYKLATLWGGKNAVLSHETVLSLLELCDVSSPKIHLTIPRGVRIRKKAGQHYELHHRDLNPDELSWFEEIKIASAFVAIQQSIENRLPLHLANQAIETAFKKRLINQQQGRELKELKGEVYGTAG